MGDITDTKNLDVFLDIALPDVPVQKRETFSVPSRKIRILFLINQLTIGGATNVVLGLAGYFHRHPGYEVQLITGPPSEGRSDVSYLAYKQGLNVQILPNLINHIHPITNLKSALDVRRVIVQGDYDIIHTHTKVPGIIGRLVAKSANTNIIIHHVHGWGSSEGMSKVVRMFHLVLERLCARFTDRFIVVAKPDIEKGLVNHIGREDQYTLIYNGIDLERFQKPVDHQRYRKELGLDQNTKLIGMIGRLEAQKNPLDFIRVAALVKESYENVQFLMVGGGPQQPECQQLIKELKLEGNFFLLGFRDDVPKILSILTMTAMTSLWEGLPIAFLESMSAGKPIVANNVDGAKDVVVDGETGFLVTPHQPVEMAERILFLLRNEALCKKMGKITQQRSKSYSKDRMLRRVEDLYQELLPELFVEKENASRQPIPV